jgi:hypothetical protein
MKVGKERGEFSLSGWAYRRLAVPANCHDADTPHRNLYSSINCIFVAGNIDLR